METMPCPHCDGTGERYIPPSILALSICRGYHIDCQPFLNVPCSVCKGKKMVPASVAVDYLAPPKKSPLALPNLAPTPV